jgi:hypothetical protein
LAVVVLDPVGVEQGSVDLVVLERFVQLGVSDGLVLVRVGPVETHRTPPPDCRPGAQPVNLPALPAD